MTDAEKAYAAAERLIEKAQDEGLYYLNFGTKEYEALEKIPNSISDLTELATLNLSGTQVYDLSPLIGLKNLTELNLSDTRVIEAKPISQLEGLSELILEDTMVSDIRSLSNLNNLTILDLDGTRVREIESLSNLQNLETLYISQNNINNFLPLSNFQRLRNLRLSLSRITDLTPISMISGLERLSISFTAVSDLSPLLSSKKLRMLDISHSAVSDLRPIIKLVDHVENKSELDIQFKDCNAALEDPNISEISEIKNKLDRSLKLIDYLKDWEPPQDKDTPDLKDIPPQTQGGARYRVGEGSKVTYLNGTEDDDLAELHDLLREDIEDLTDKCVGGHNSPFAPFHALLDRYQQALGATLADLKTLRFWNQGNKLRQELLSTQNRSDYDLDGPPPLSSDLEDGLAALVALHNSFCAAHSRLSELDRNRIDPIHQPRAAEDRKLIGDLVSVLKDQDKVIAPEVREDFEDLDNAAQGDSETELRNLQVEKDSLENLLKVITTGSLKYLRTSAVVVGPALAAHYAIAGPTAQTPFVVEKLYELLFVLQPQINAALSCWHGKDYPLLQTINWIAAKVRQRIRPE